MYTYVNKNRCNHEIVHAPRSYIFAKTFCNAIYSVNSSGLYISDVWDSTVSKTFKNQEYCRNAPIKTIWCKHNTHEKMSCTDIDVSRTLNVNFKWNIQSREYLWWIIFALYNSFVMLLTGNLCHHKCIGCFQSLHKNLVIIVFPKRFRKATGVVCPNLSN